MYNKQEEQEEQCNEQVARSVSKKNSDVIHDVPKSKLDKKRRSSGMIKMEDDLILI